MATAPMPDLTGLDKTAQLDALRRRMAAIPARLDHAPTDLTPTRHAVEASESPPSRQSLPGRAWSSTNRQSPRGARKRFAPFPCPCHWPNCSHTAL
ncbi:hypothetical protein A3K89_22270 [Rhodococcoides kyotonense]|uniref:Uncharacterized protein n=1 Tax=Rhodococcoides kyotonense TaxID=398843 RepID=A0A177YE81_9NOCA|nr:hypothetical protein A3K89_22270 [Rhodococcus kyotonensis]